MTSVPEMHFKALKSAFQNLSSRQVLDMKCHQKWFSLHSVVQRSDTDGSLRSWDLSCFGGCVVSPTTPVMLTVLD